MMLVICRIGSFIPVPGINGDEAVRVFEFALGGGQNLFQLVDIFSGGAFAQMTIFALGVMPYISASIILQLMVALVPSIQREMRESSDQGKKKVGRWTRLLTVALALFQAALFGKYVLSLNASHPGIIVPEILSVTIFGFPILYFALITAAMGAGTVFLMWVGEQITDRGIGNGMSLIIALGILSSIPTTIGTIIGNLNLDSQEAGTLSLPSAILLAALFVAIIIGTILVIQGQRRIPLQYARRGSEASSEKSAYIPLKINYAGVIPVIFASSLLMFPATIAQFTTRGGWLHTMVSYLSPGSSVHMALYVALIIFFTYFWTATQFRPDQIASDMKKSGAFIPGVRQGEPTKSFLESTMNRITLCGALFLALIAVLPTLIGKGLRIDPTISHFFGGTSLLILVGVILDTTKQIESHMLMKRYDGFLQRGRMSGRL
jgi:preprotein translocase subunit SecY